MLLVSIITPMYNSETFILETISSVINQTYKNWELILIDDCSKDSTLQKVDHFLSKYANIKLIKNDINLGAAISRNKGIKASKGSYIAFLDDDDLWKPNKLEVQIAFMNTNKYAVSYSSYEKIDKKGNPLNILVEALPILEYNKYLKSNYIGNLTGIYSVEILGKIKVPNLRKRQDWLLWLSVIKKAGQPAYGIDESLAYYRVRENTMSSNKFDLIKYNYWVYKKGLKFSTIKSICCMIVFFKEHFFVKSKQIVSLNNS